jgi:hypothetical protein
VVVPAEVAHRQLRQSGRRLQAPVSQAQRASDLQQAAGIQLAPPVSLYRLFEFAPGADARKAEIVGRCHDRYS